ncbi:hypothetical protein F6R98_13255 [Candidatus Methylospira mobilis]|uniref:Uncharacterized protein n=1 Tax=Candidatus Methylospira mobilis TaxID=1808979 RepID=A0A5Q0BSQ2_9GAMM|nr:hypothetical protein F6R98_13255 [Candidatus Methylospira mobilis]
MREEINRKITIGTFSLEAYFPCFVKAQQDESRITFFELARRLVSRAGSLGPAYCYGISAQD